MKRKTSRGVRIGDWVYDPKRLVVSYRKDRMQFEVDLERCTTSAEVFDWIIYVKKRSAANRGCVEDLVAILDRLLDPQDTLCSWGKEKGPLPKGNALRKLIAKHIKQWQVIDCWRQDLKSKHGMGSFIRPEDWKELERMQLEAGLRGDKPNLGNGGMQL
jgi:hypothetical protein